ncbi:adenosine kinase [Parasphingopyxis algicola]|uniref:adenosine kinase n=1 Tax=Parasphingopyxis algicola TaxID=2026624 RepID=UPI0015A10E4B|nr:adenosine kinase [Parasphingopyxis algicola]QLC26039.1 adenosine kinase [Parasphingopyxis algicola]
MHDTDYDVLAIGDAVVDVIAPTDDALLAEEGLRKGSMRVLDRDGAERLYERMGPAQEMSGGSAANSMAGIAALGGRAAFVGQIGSDQLGTIFAHDIRAQGVAFDTPALDGDVTTGRCLILVTPDAQRTMNTYRGASEHLSVDAIDPAQVAKAAILYLEAYLWDHDAPRVAMKKAADMAHDASRPVAFTLSDIACIGRHRPDFVELVGSGRIDILFGNEDEARALARHDDLDDAIAALAGHVDLCVITRGADGAIAVGRGERVAVPAVPPRALVDTTGAGDLFAAGFLAGHAWGRPLEASLALGAAAAAEVIADYGARPLGQLRHLAAD